MSIVLFGPPGSGKGTQSEVLVSKFGYVQISTGDILRRAMLGKTALGLQAAAFVNKGELVPDQLVIDLVDEALLTLGNKKFILDGFPRTVAQAKALAEILQKRSLSLKKAVFLEVSTEKVVARLTGRRVCTDCGAVFHIISRPAKVEDKCDMCGGKLIQRADDTEEVIVNRLKTYEINTSPLKSFYKEIGVYSEVDGTRAVDVVSGDIEIALGLK